MYVTCHGCGGKGWVVVDGKPHVCPICRGAGRIPYDWKRPLRNYQVLW